jgi:predicted RNase H-like nuclease (RuvC/YqgF family)
VEGGKGQLPSTIFAPSNPTQVPTKEVPSAVKESRVKSQSSMDMAASRVGEGESGSL